MTEKEEVEGEVEEEKREDEGKKKEMEDFYSSIGDTKITSVENAFQFFLNCLRFYCVKNVKELKLADNILSGFFTNGKKTNKKPARGRKKKPAPKARGKKGSKQPQNNKGMDFLYHLYNNFDDLKKIENLGIEVCEGMDKNIESVIFNGIRNLCIRNLCGKKKPFPFKFFHCLHESHLEFVTDYIKAPRGKQYNPTKFQGFNCLKILKIHLMLCIHRGSRAARVEGAKIMDVVLKKKDLLTIVSDMRKKKEIFEETLDSIECHIEKKAFPDILPNDDEILLMGPEKTKLRICEYVGIGPDLINRFFVSGGFLSQKDDLGEIICGSMEELKDLGLTRKQVSTRLGGMTKFFSYIGKKKRKKPKKYKDFEVDVQRTFGVHLEPFHYSFPRRNNTFEHDYIGGQCGVKIKNKKKTMFGGGGEVVVEFADMLPYLVRTAGFFEGTVSYRLDPKLVYEVVFKK